MEASTRPCLDRRLARFLEGVCRRLGDRRGPALLCLVALGVLLAYVLVFVLDYLIVACQALVYPQQLEWMEGGVVDVVARVRRGDPLYVEPSVDYVPYLYPPLYFWASAGVSLLTGVDLIAPRLLSAMATAACAAAIFGIVQRTGSLAGAVLAACLFIATFEASGAWFHLARVDSFALALSLAALQLLVVGSGRTSAAVAGMLAACAVLAKQSSALVLTPVLLGLLPLEPRRALLAGGVAAGLAGAAAAALQLGSGGWFVYYVWDVGRQHMSEPGMIAGFWRLDIAPLVPGLAVGALGLAVVARQRPRCATLVAACWLP